MTDIHIISIREEEFYFKGHGIIEIDVNRLYNEYSRTFEWDLLKNTFTVKFTAKYLYDQGESELDLSSMTIATTFEIEDLQEQLRVEERAFELSLELLKLIISSAVSTTRALLGSKLAGTILGTFYLPFLDVHIFIDDTKTKGKKKKEKVLV
ncbi:hypothetical protein OQZ33_24075 [Pedobacter sp. MC2016-05]|uniref:hypothetical protein n=1 Tax=Pedobacter sp. MC2016-05 TaxID=2994474 RepID=UPI0022480EA0|nr:hypothetical protein [Pedobacter sp. MC2016-05]MCX2477428.1 hypothetical protein [Pedobacter sp. MC2016-05]